VIDAVISLPLNVFYGAGVPACLLILRKQRPADRRDQILLIYAARHYRELSAQNELRPQDVMRMIVHYHAYGDATKVPSLVSEHSGRIRKLIDLREEDEVGRLEAEYQIYAEKFATLNAEIADTNALQMTALTDVETTKVAATVSKLEKQRDKVAFKIVERDEKIAAARHRANDDRKDVSMVGEGLVRLYAIPDELLKHIRVASLEVIEDNEFNLNIPRYVDTFEPEPLIEVTDALKALRLADLNSKKAEAELSTLLKDAGYAE
jgi:type I restriction enzyme M protein